MSSVEELFNNNEKMGSLCILVALVGLVLTILGIITAVVWEFSIFFVILVAIGTLVFVYLTYQFGVELRDNSVDKVPLPFVTNIIGPLIDHSHKLTRSSIFAGIVKYFGMGLIISSIFFIIAYAVEGLGFLIGAFVIRILIGLVFLWASKEISAGGNHSFMWILLVVLFAILLIISLISIIGSLVILDLIGIASALMLMVFSGYALYLGMTPEVKTQMGV